MTITPKALNQGNKGYGMKDDQVGWDIAVRRIGKINEEFERGHFDNAIETASEWVKLKLKSLNDLPKMDESHLAAFYYMGKSYLGTDDTDYATGCFHIVYSQSGFARHMLASYRQFVDLSRTELEGIAAQKGENYINSYDVAQFAADVVFKKGCFIATAVYGSAIAPEVKVFRQFRDQVMLPSKLGRVLIALYSFASPPLARLISRVSLFRLLTRRLLLKPILWLFKTLEGRAK